MRRQPRAWASSTSVSSRGDSEPFCFRKFAVQSIRRPTVQAWSVVTGGSFLRESAGAPARLMFSRLRALPQPLLLVEVDEGLDQPVEPAGDDGVELVQGEVDAVVGDAVLREVVGADALAAVARADQGAALLGPLAVQGLLL